MLQIAGNFALCLLAFLTLRYCLNSGKVRR